MSKYQSSTIRQTRRVIIDNIYVFTPLVFTGLSAVLILLGKYFTLFTQVLVYMILLNAVFLLRRNLGFYNVLIALYVVGIFNSLLMLLGLKNSLYFTVDLSLIITVLFLLPIYRHVLEQADIMRDHVPFIVLLSVFTGLILNVADALLYPLLTIIDTISALIAKTYMEELGEKYLTLLTAYFIFLTIYLSFDTSLSVCCLALFSFTSILRNIILLDFIRVKHGLKSLIFVFDILYKPIAVAYL